MRREVFPLLAVLVLLVSPIGAAGARAAPEPVAPQFERVWDRTDLPVAQRAVPRTWVWGPAPLTGAIAERYLDSPGAQRLIQYFDKGRMEITNPGGNPDSPWYVTSGLLTRELISGRIQIGNTRFLQASAGAAIAVAGDPDNPFPTYRDLAGLIDRSAPDQTGQFATRLLSASGESSRTDVGDDRAVEFIQYITYTGPAGTPVGYNIPRAFWEFMTQPGLVHDAQGSAIATPLFDWLFVLGYPLSDPFWVQVRVAGAEQWVLVQPFERRVLTYTPANPDGWKVEMGNIGRHYYTWRYQATPPVALLNDRTRPALADGDRWVYSTTLGIDELWAIAGTSRSFSGGSTLVTRSEQRGSHHTVTYWSVTADGVHLYGFDKLDFSGQIVDSTVYWPPVRYLPNGGLSVGQHWSTTTTALSLDGPPREGTIAVEVVAYQLVATPAGYFPAWKLAISAPDTLGSRDTDALSSTVWFAPSIGVVQWLGDGFAAQLQSATTVPDSGSP